MPNKQKLKSKNAIFLDGISRTNENTYNVKCPNESQKAVVIDVKVKVIVIWIINCASLGCILVRSMKYVSEIASEIWPIV